MGIGWRDIKKAEERMRWKDDRDYFIKALPILLVGGLIGLIEIVLLLCWG